MDFLDLAFFLLFEGSFLTSFFMVVVEAKTSGPPHVLKL